MWPSLPLSVWSLLLTPVVLAALMRPWEDPSEGRFEHIHTGMTEAEVAAELGHDGQDVPVYTSGNLHNLHLRHYYGRRWANSSGRLTVYFEGPRDGVARAVGVVPSPP